MDMGCRNGPMETDIKDIGLKTLHMDKVFSITPIKIFIRAISSEIKPMEMALLPKLMGRSI